MTSDLKLLILEDNPDDAELLQRLLKKAGLRFNAIVASDENEFHAALQNDGYDAVLADNALPQYSSAEALKLVRELNPHVAFILVTGTVSEEFAVSIIQQGADDYILKTNLTRLPAALTNAIEKKKVKKEVEQEKDLSVSIINSMPGVFYLYDEEGHFIRWNKNLETASGYSATDIKTMKPVDFLEAQNRDAAWAWIRQVFAAGYAETEAIVVTKSGERVPYFLTGTTIMYGDQNCLIGIGVDISTRKNSEIELRQLNEQLRQLSQHLHTIREEEQRRIAREIHDELGQQVTALKMDLSTIKKSVKDAADPLAIQQKISAMNGLLDETVRTIRKISSELHPSVLDELGLVAALDWQSMEFSKRFNIPVEFIANKAAKNLQLNLNIATGIFRIYQESLTNIARHAEATLVKASLHYGKNIILVTIADNGKGFDTTKKGPKKTLGLLGVKERAYMIGGTVDIQSEPGKGTQVSITVLIQ